MKRPVMTYKSVLAANHQQYDTVEDGQGLFVQYGCDYEEFESGPGNYSTAIVEMPDGTVKNIPVGKLKFLDGV